MHGARQQFLAGAALAEQQRRGHRGCDLFDLAAQAQHLVAHGDDAFERVVARRRQQAPVLRLERVHVKGPLDDQNQDVGVDRLLVEIVGPAADRPHGVVEVAVARDHNDFRVRCERENLLERRESLADALGVGRQPEVLQNDRRLVTAHLGDCRWPVGREGDFVVVEAPAKLTLDAGIVLNDQQLGFLLAHLMLPMSYPLARARRTAPAAGRREIRCLRPSGSRPPGFRPRRA